MNTESEREAVLEGIEALTLSVPLDGMNVRKIQEIASRLVYHAARLQALLELEDARRLREACAACFEVTR